MITRQIRNDKELQLAIFELERQKDSDAVQLKAQWDFTRKNLNPMTLLKDGVKDLFVSRDVRSGALKGIVSLATGFLAKKLIVGKDAGIGKKMLGTLAQTGATTLAFKGTDAIQQKGASVLSSFLKKLKIGK